MLAVCLFGCLLAVCCIQWACLFDWLLLTCLIACCFHSPSNAANHCHTSLGACVCVLPWYLIFVEINQFRSWRLPGNWLFAPPWPCPISKFISHSSVFVRTEIFVFDFLRAGGHLVIEKPVLTREHGQWEEEEEEQEKNEMRGARRFIGCPARPTQPGR